MTIKHFIFLFLAVVVVAFGTSYGGDALYQAQHHNTASRNIMKDAAWGNSGPSGTTGAVTSVTAGDTSVTIGGTATAPTVAVNQGNAMIWSAAQTFQNEIVNTFVPTSACATSAPTAPLCIGSPTSTAAIAIGKTTGGWGGTTSSASGLLCFVVNGGTADSACTTSGTAIGGGSNGDLNLYSSHNVVINTKLVATNLDANGSNVQDFRHIGSLVSCSGTGTFTNANSNDAYCMITLSSGVASMTFKTAWAVAPVCVATDTTAANAVKASATTTVLTLAGTSSDVIAVHCGGNGGV